MSKVYVLYIYPSSIHKLPSARPYVDADAVFDFFTIDSFRANESFASRVSKSTGYIIQVK